MGRSGVWLFIAGLLVVASVGACVVFYDRAKRAEADGVAARARDADRIEQLEAQLRLAQAEASEYREKLDDAERIARELETEREAHERVAMERAARIEALERELESAAEPAKPEEPVVASFTEPDKATAAGTARGEEPVISSEPVLAEDVASGPGEETPAVSGEPSAAAGTEQADVVAAGGATGELEREIEELRAEKRDLERQHAALLGRNAGGVPIGEVKVATGLKIKGKVLVVNDRYDFVVLDVGARDGIEKGMVLILHRGKRFVGKCQVGKVYNDKAAADLVLDWMKDDVRVGDGVRKF
jgi:hypothetical protein